MRFVGIVILLFLALLAGASVGAVAKFGFGYELEINGRQARSGSFAENCCAENRRIV
jgi:hypothetical protein